MFNKSIKYSPLTLILALKTMVLQKLLNMSKNNYNSDKIYCYKL